MLILKKVLRECLEGCKGFWVGIIFELIRFFIFLLVTNLDNRKFIIIIYFNFILCL